MRYASRFMSLIYETAKWLIYNSENHVGQYLFVAQHSTVKIPMDFSSAIHTFQRENVGYEKMCLTYLVFLFVTNQFWQQSVQNCQCQLN